LPKRAVKMPLLWMERWKAHTEWWNRSWCEHKV
jgi:hypothetical protein